MLEPNVRCSDPRYSCAAIRHMLIGETMKRQLEKVTGLAIDDLTAQVSYRDNRDIGYSISRHRRFPS
jgi:hypothetical protein